MESPRAVLTGAARATEDSSMVVRGHVVRWAVLLLTVVSGCRGEATEREPVVAPADARLAWPAIDEPALIALAASEDYTLGVSLPLAITPDGAVVFQRSKPRDRGAELYQLDASGKTTVLATAAALGTGAPAGAVPEIELSDDGTRVMAALAGRVYLIERPGGTARELAIGPHRDPQLSPDGKHLAFVRDGDLWVATTAVPGTPGAAPPVRITQHPPDRDYATAELVAPALGRNRGYWWSPDGQSIVFQRTSAGTVDTLYRSDPRHPELAPVAEKLPRSGRTNATVDLGIVSLRGGAPRWVTWELARYPYLARVIWPARGALTLVVVNREQTQIAALAVDPATAATRPLVIDKDPAWINLAPEPLRWLPDGSGFLWMTERRGAWSLERYAADGSDAGQAVAPDVGLRRVAGISPDGRELIIEATTDPREQHVWRVPLAGGAPVALTSGGGVHRAWSGHGVVAILSAGRTGGRATAVLRPDGSRLELPSVAERPRLAPTTRLETVTLDDHLQYAAITRPRSFDPKVRYPVLLRVAADPDASAVLDASDTYLWDQWYADAGFIVIRSDGRGTPGRDRTWQRAIAGDVLTIPMNDQIGALKRLGAQHPELDLGRVGIVGTELGGYLATLGVMLHPDVFAAAVAVSPITDWEQLPSAFAERYMKTPATNPEGYRRTSASTYAEQLTRPLLLLHGVTDDHVAFAHSLLLLEALAEAGKHVELATLPASPATARTVAGARLALDFLREHLGPPVRPAVMPAPRSEEDDEDRERARDHGGGPEHRDAKDRRGTDH